MKFYRTDLAIELNEHYDQDLEGINISEEFINQLKVSKVDIKTKEASERFGKPIGVYFTIDVPILKNFSLLDNEELNFIASKISSFLPQNEGLVLVVGLGNREITPDSIGPRTISKIISTRHVKQDVKLRNNFDSLRSVAAIAPGVLGQTGIEISEIIKSLVDKVKPATVILIDALVSKNVNRLGKTIQISNSGISPGSGVVNQRKEISQDFLGVPIISIGIPTVVDARTLINDLSEAAPKENIKSMIVTPNEIDMIIKKAADILGLVINKALQRDLSFEEIESLVS